MLAFLRCLASFAALLLLAACQDKARLQAETDAFSDDIVRDRALLIKANAELAALDQREATLVKDAEVAERIAALEAEVLDLEMHLQKAKAESEAALQAQQETSRRRADYQARYPITQP